VILMEAKLQTLADGVEKVADLVLDHERRLIRIETLVEVAQSNRLPPVDG
jgi:hypothetical protein